MECLSLALASSSTSCFDCSFIKLHSVSMMGSSLILPHLPSAIAVPFRGAPAFKRIQLVPLAATVGEATLSAETTLNSSTPSKKVLVPIGHGTEEMEAVILVHMLRQAGADVTVASVEPQLEVKASGGLKLVADASIDSCSKEIFDLIALPGGMPGSARLRDCKVLQEITSKQA